MPHRSVIIRAHAIGGKKISPRRISYFTILATHIVMLMFFDSQPLGLRQTFYFMLAAQVAVNTILHYLFCRQGKVAPFALPLMWLSCVVPLYIYCFHVTNNWNEPGLFTLLGLGILLPITVVSALTAAGYSLTRMIEKNRKE